MAPQRLLLREFLLWYAGLARLVLLEEGVFIRTLVQRGTSPLLSFSHPFFLSFPRKDGDPREQVT